MTIQVRVALALWAVLAVVVFNVTFDWQTRAAGHAFATEQIRRHAGGIPVVSIHDGLRPMVRSAAIRSVGWLSLVMGVGAVATTVAAPRT